MRHSLIIYIRLVGVLIRSQVNYRVNFWFDVITTGLLTVLGFTSLSLIIQRFGNIAGWTLADVAFLYGLVEGAFGSMDLIFSCFDPQAFGRKVRLGQFDQLLLRPVNITLQVLSSDLALRRLGRIFQGLFVLILAFSWLDIHWSIWKVLYIPLVFLGMVFFFGGLFIIGSTVTFWTVESIEVVNIFTYGGSEMMSYPMHIYPGWMRRFFTYIIPAIFLNYYPALYILGKPDPFGFAPTGYFLSPIVGLGMLLTSLAFWSIGIRHYQSTGS